MGERERERERGKCVGQVEVSAAVAAVPVHIFSKHFLKKTKIHFAVIRVNINLIKMFYFKFYILGRYVRIMLSLLFTYVRAT